MDTPSTVVDDVYTPIRPRSCWMLMLSTVAMCKDQISYGPGVSIYQYPEIIASTVCSIR